MRLELTSEQVAKTKRKALVGSTSAASESRLAKDIQHVSVQAETVSLTFAQASAGKALYVPEPVADCAEALMDVAAFKKALKDRNQHVNPLEHHHKQHVEHSVTQFKRSEHIISIVETARAIVNCRCGLTGHGRVHD